MGQSLAHYLDTYVVAHRAQSAGGRDRFGPMKTAAAYFGCTNRHRVALQAVWWDSCMCESVPVKTEALRKHDGLQVTVLLFFSHSLLLQQGHQRISLLHHIQHLAQYTPLLRQLILPLQIIWERERKRCCEAVINWRTITRENHKGLRGSWTINILCVY